MTGKEKALLIIKQHKKDAEDIYRERLELLSADEVFDTLFRKCCALKWDYVKSKTENECIKISNEIEIIENRINNYISEKGLPYNWLSIPYSCSLCNDSGFKNGKECVCVEQKRIETELNDNPLLKNVPCGLKKINYSYYGEESAMKKNCASIINKGMKSGKTIFLIAGKTGTAKTYIASSAVRGELEKGKSVLALSAVKLGKKFLEYHCSPIESKTAKFNVLTDPDVLLIDDLGAEQMLNNVTVPYLIELLTERAENKMTFITTNLSPNDLENRYGQRVLSRILDKNLSLPIALGGKDLRIY